jgi:hypothetical protein
VTVISSDDAKVETSLKAVPEPHPMLTRWECHIPIDDQWRWMFDVTSTRHWPEAGSEGSPSKRFLLGDTRESISLNDSSMEDLSEDDRAKLIFPWDAASQAAGVLIETGNSVWLAEFATSKPPLVTHYTAQSAGEGDVGDLTGWYERITRMGGTTENVESKDTQPSLDAAAADE